MIFTIYLFTYYFLGSYKYFYLHFYTRCQVTGSHASLVSAGSVYSSQEERTNAEISKLRRELGDEHKKVTIIIIIIIT